MITTVLLHCPTALGARQRIQLGAKGMGIMQKACCETHRDLSEVVERLHRRAELQHPVRTVVCHPASTVPASQKSFLVEDLVELSFS